MILEFRSPILGKGFLKVLTCLVSLMTPTCMQTVFKSPRTGFQDSGWSETLLLSWKEEEQQEKRRGTPCTESLMCPPPCAPAQGQVKTLAQFLPGLPGFSGQENGTRAPPVLSSENLQLQSGDTAHSPVCGAAPLVSAAGAVGLPRLGVRGARRHPAGGDARRRHKLVARRGVL